MSYYDNTYYPTGPPNNYKPISYTPYTPPQTIIQSATINLSPEAKELLERIALALECLVEKMGSGFE